MCAKNVYNNIKHWRNVAKCMKWTIYVLGELMFNLKQNLVKYDKKYLRYKGWNKKIEKKVLKWRHKMFATILNIEAILLNC